MAVLTAPTALTETAFAGGPLGPTHVENNFNLANGSKFAGGPGTYLSVRNTTAGAIGVDFLMDLNGAEVKLIDGSVTANKVAASSTRMFGPFPAGALDHTTNSSTNAGQVFCNQLTGIAGDLKATVLHLDRG